VTWDEFSRHTGTTSSPRTPRTVSERRYSYRHGISQRRTTNQRSEAIGASATETTGVEASAFNVDFLRFSLSAATPTLTDERLHDASRSLERSVGTVTERHEACIRLCVTARSSPSDRILVGRIYNELRVRLKKRPCYDLFAAVLKDDECIRACQADYLT
jgi:hypothetical protein